MRRNQFSIRLIMLFNLLRALLGRFQIRSEGFLSKTQLIHDTCFVMGFVDGRAWKQGL